MKIPVLLSIFLISTLVGCRGGVTDAVVDGSADSGVESADSGVEVEIRPEIELKLTVDKPEALADALAATRRLGGMEVVDMGVRDYRDDYFDTIGNDLFHRACSFRVRRTWSGAVKLEWKTPVQRSDGIWSRTEHVERFDHGQLEDLRAAGETFSRSALARRVVEWVHQRPLRPTLVVIDARRTFFLGPEDAPRFVLTIDRVEFEGLVGRRARSAYAEVELEILTEEDGGGLAELERLSELVRERFAHCGLAPSTGSKYETGVRAVVLDLP